MGPVVVTEPLAGLVTPEEQGASGRAAPGTPRSGSAWRLRTYFALLGVCLVVAAGAAIAYVEVQTGRDARASGEQTAQAAATVSAAQLAKSLGTLRSSVAALAANPAIAQAFDQPQGCSLSFDLGGHLDVVAPDGAVACSSQPRKDASYADRPWLRSALREPTFDAPISDTVTGRETLLSTAPIPGGKGFVAGFVNLRPLGSELVRLYGGGQPLLLMLTDDAHDRVLSRSLAPNRWIGRSVAGTRFARGAHGEVDGLDGVSRYYANATVPGTHWRIDVGEPKSLAEAAGRRLERRELYIIVVGLIGVLIAAFLVYRRTATPLVHLAAAVRATDPETGEGTVPVAGPKEVGDLGEDVNALIASVRVELAERRRAEESLRASEESYRLLFVRHPNPMWIFDTDTRRFLDVNEAAVHAYGWSRDEFLAMTIDEIRPQEDVATLHRTLEAIDDGAAHSSIWRHVRKDGGRIDAAISSNVVEFAGRPARVVLAQDVTEQRRLEEQLRQTQKLEAIGRLAGGVAHDFNNLLVVIRGYSATLAQALTDDDELQEQAIAIDHAGERAATLTRQLLAFSRQQVLRPTVVDVNAVVRETQALLDRLIGEDVQMTVDLVDDPWLVLADAGQLTQVVLNLVVNARDAMPSGGRLSIKTDNVELDADYAASHVGVEAGRYLMLQMTDTGVGMDRETQEHVFEPFFTTKEEGTGLGLATVHGIVSQTGGHIWLYSEPGLGTTFKLYFKRTERRPVERARPPEVAVLDGTETILLVEDEEGVRTFVATILRGHGYRVLEADRADRAEALAAESEGIDLLITDVVMPGRNGRELAELLQASTPTMRVLFTSGYPADNALRAGLSDAATAFIEKPFGPDELARAVRELLDDDQAAA
jgi:PAS domain S-box-containing protein